MENAQLISLSRQIALQRQMDVVANNMANINTTGFKAESLLVSEYVSPNATDEAFTSFLDQQLHFTENWSTLHDMRPGAITQTGNPLDIALSGDGFLTVRTPAGERYTRAGALQVNASGLLVTTDGHPVLSDLGPIRFADNETDIAIARNGTISTNTGSKGALRLVEFANPQELSHEGDNLYSGGTPVANVGTQVIQGAIERSNVSGVATMADMIRVQRAYQTLATLMQQQDELRTSAVQRLGDIAA